ncbi:MAG: ATP-binding protein [Bacteroidales bacterium]|nr:ATP-binding protein [Bacteroidales bacterium]
MYSKRFEPIGDKCHEIIEYVMASPDIPSQDDLIFKIRLSIEEVIENIVQYAYENGSGFLEVSTKQEDGVLYINFTDAGTPFNPLDKPDPDISLSAEDRPIGGLGIFISKQMMDKIEYEYKDGCNVLTMSKRVIPA